MQSILSPRSLLQFRSLRAFTVLLVFWSGAAVFSTGFARAQVRIPSAALENITLEDVIRKGADLERQRRWGDALSHYEDALRTHPGPSPQRAELEQRVSFTRARFDVARRYKDHTFLKGLENLDKERALDLYGEVLLKVQTHYVDTPNWQEMIRRGSLNLDVALAEPRFVRRNIPHVTQQHLTRFRREFHRVLGGRIAYDRRQARDLVAAATAVAQRELRITPQAVILEYVAGALGALDPYSAYLTGGQLDDLFSQIEGNFVGLGVEIKSKDHALLIVDVISGGPAAVGGIRPGDRIIEVDGVSTSQVSTDEAADMLKGPEGSTVAVLVMSGQQPARRLQLTRRMIDVPCVEDVKILDSDYGIGYFRLTSFQKTTSREVDAALWKLHRQGMRSLIVDVRGNPGGLLSAAVEVGDKFVASGVIVSTRGRSPREDFDYKAHKVGTWSVPLTVLIDNDSASASEIFAGAISDHRRGAVVGQKSYGKGSVQGIFPLNLYKAGVRLTTAKFYSPSGRPISKRGVSPDIVVRTVAKPTSDGLPIRSEDDEVVRAGLQTARQRLTQLRN